MNRKLAALVSYFALTAIAMAYCFAPSATAADTGAAASAEVSTEVPGDVLTFEKQVEVAIVRGDGAFLDKICASDFSFTHGDGWTTGGAPLRVENRAQWLASNSKARYLFRELDSVKVELHGDIAITYGRYRARFKPGIPEQREFTVWFERVYARRNGAWQYLSHRTVHGPVYKDAPSAQK